MNRTAGKLFKFVNEPCQIFSLGILFGLGFALQPGLGSKLTYNKENLEKSAEILRKRSVFGEVEISFMCRDTRTVSEAIDIFAGRSVSKIVLVPAFLAAGVHTTQDIPELIEVKEKELQLKAREIDLYYGKPIGSDERIAKIFEKKP